MQLISSHHALEGAPHNALSHDIICQCPYSRHPMEEHEDELTRYIFTTRSPAFAIYHAFAAFQKSKETRFPLLVKIDIQKLPSETKIADFSEGAKEGAKKFERQCEKHRVVVVRDRIPTHAVVGFLRIK